MAKVDYPVGLEVCYYCGDDTGVVIGRRPKMEELPKRAVYSKMPCPECEEHMRQGVIMIEVDEAKTTDPKNPYRTGNFVVVAEAAIRRAFGEFGEAQQILLDKRVAFLDTETWDYLGLPRPKEEALDA